jgi:hypothetical protein
VPDANSHIALSGGGPAALVLAGTRLYTLTRFNDSVAVIDLTQGAVGAEIQSVRLHNPEPRRIIGRPPVPLTTRSSPAVTASRRARAATSSATWTTSRGTSETPTKRGEQQQSVHGRLGQSVSIR